MDSENNAGKKLPSRPRTADKVSNGRLMPKSVDLRSAPARRFKALLARYTLEVGGKLTEAEWALLRQGVALQLEAERMQADIANGVVVDGDMLVRISSEARRALSAVLTRAAKNKPAGGGLRAYLASRAAAPDGEAA